MTTGNILTSSKRTYIQNGRDLLCSHVTTTLWQVDDINSCMLRISSDTVIQERSPVMTRICTGVELRPPARLTLHVRGGDVVSLT